MRWLAPVLATAAFAQTPPAKTPGELQRAAIAQQKEAARVQAKATGAWLIPGEKPPQPPCDPIDTSVVDPLIDSAAKAQKLEPKLVRAVIAQESAFRPCAVSFKGAQGLMQLMPETADQFAVADPFDPQQNIDAGTKYLKQLIDKYQGNLEQALGAYNAGPGAVDQAGGQVPNIPETRDYVKAILDQLRPKPTDPPSIQMPKPIEN